VILHSMRTTGCCMLFRAFAIGRLSLVESMHMIAKYTVRINSNSHTNQRVLRNVMELIVT
jgi:hypothetical protein